MKYLISTLLLLLIFTVGYSQTATYYADKYHGRKTANGEVFSQNKMTCASNVYKMGTVLKVTNPKTKKYVIVRVNDTGNLYGRTIDLSKAAFASIANLKYGVIHVIIEVISKT